MCCFWSSNKKSNLIKGSSSIWPNLSGVSLLISSEELMITSLITGNWVILLAIIGWKIVENESYTGVVLDLWNPVLCEIGYSSASVCDLEHCSPI